MVPTPPQPLIDAIVRRRAVMFAGAGVSMGQIDTPDGPLPQPLPGWGGLLKQMIDHGLAVGQLDAAVAGRLRRALDERKFLFVAEEIRRKIGRRDYADALEATFRNPALRPTGRHRRIAAIPFSAVLTTNYDKLLELAYAERGELPRTYTHGDAPDVIAALAENRFFIFKAHGDIDRKDSIILSERDFRDVIYREPGYRAALNTIFITKTVLFVGASLTDTDVSLVLEAVNEAFLGQGTRHYALVPDHMVVTEEVQHWRDFFGIQLLPYDATPGHPEIDRFLDGLAAEVASRLEPVR